jgi:hypothetical protein
VKAKFLFKKWQLVEYTQPAILIEGYRKDRLRNLWVTGSDDSKDEAPPGDYL